MIYMELKTLAKKLLFDTLEDIQPEKLVKEKLKELRVDKKVYVLSIGKAAWKMAKAASDVLDIEYGIVITKYGYNFGNIENFDIFEAGHPIPDENSLSATKFAVEKFSKLSRDDILLFLISGGGSSTFELLQDGLSLEDLKNVTTQLLKSGANIKEINTIRSRLSKVKGGRFLNFVKSKVITLVLSDVLENDLRYIASGPTYEACSTFEDAYKIIKKYNLDFNENIINVLKKDVKINKQIDVEHYIIGSIDIACDILEKHARKYNLNTLVLTTRLDCEAKEAGKFIASIAKSSKLKTPYCIIFGGETVVKVKGSGKGGRNQELCYSAALEIENMKDVVIASVGTDGTDGPTDAAGAIVDGKTISKVRKFSNDPNEFLLNNDTYNALKLSGDLLITGPTGTNLNDIGFILKG
ncbi:glycerate kinase [Thermosipho sp. (in: thermotogales)]|uniref:glycerate kinase type-2 family protein n=1 Tax=Thermosipho sp. (in: thermotogales) TaxID=1968895 RepID=UPI00257E9EF5|nr:glycerate kinase [Thermosipho sp. (in: thermotogales)]